MNGIKLAKKNMWQGHQQAAPSVHYTTRCKRSLMLLRMGEIIARNMLSWLKLSIKFVIVTSSWLFILFFRLMDEVWLTKNFDNSHWITWCAHFLNVPVVYFHIWPDDGSVNWNMSPNFLILITIFLILITIYTGCFRRNSKYFRMW